MKFSLQLSQKTIAYAPVAIVFIAVLLGGIFLLDRSNRQARDTIRKHHLQDIEDSLYLARNLNGTFPPYDQPHWCGRLNDPANAEVKQQVEQALRQKIEKYSNPEKPFPADPLRSEDSTQILTTHYSLQPNNDYFYWKRSPAVFELYSILEADRNGNRTTENCPTDPNLQYDYGLNSALRENV